jgi:hypothetical protein
MRVGVNYPWFDYGWDFGLGPAAWRGSRTSPRWYDEIDRHLDHFRALGISVVRWFVLADGLTYGTGAEAPTAHGERTTGWNFEPPSLDPSALDHFDELLRRFENARGSDVLPIQLLPVFLDFQFCFPGTVVTFEAGSTGGRESDHETGWIKGGRAEAIGDVNKRQLFFDRALEPLLQVSRRRPGVICAWELMNEPDWITTGWQRRLLTLQPLDAGPMTAFLEEGKDRIRRAGFKATIGFASSMGMRRSRITADLNQFHHYPRGGSRLERHAFDPRYPGIIGEFATAPGDEWPELSGAGQTVLNRLRVAAARGYPLALPWSFLASDRHTNWSGSVEDDLRAFNSEQDDG